MNLTVKDIRSSLKTLNIEKGIYFITKIDKGIESKNYFVGLNSRNNLRYILKIYPNDNEVRYEIEILNKLSSSNKPLFSPLVQEGVFFINNKPSILLRYITGCILAKNKISLPVIREIAKKQAKMHLSLLNFKPKNKKVRFSVFDFNFLSFFCKNDKSLYYRKILEEIKIIEKESKSFTKIDFKKTIIHEDLTPENILITKNGDINFVDFGESHYAEMISDIAITIKEIIISNVGVDLLLIQNYLNSYQKIITLDKKEINTLFFMIKRRTIFMLAYYLGRYEINKDFKKKNAVTR